MKKILLALQYWDGDRERAMGLARFIADLQEGHSDAADFLFVRRFDCKESDDDTVRYVARKFNVHTLHCRRREVGWPMGCNGLWFGTVEHVFHNLSGYKSLLTFEADCCPITRDWISRLTDRWDKLNKRDTVYIAGALVSYEGMHDHINGNALISTDLDFMRWACKRSHCPPRAGWDYWLAPEFKARGWAGIPEITSEWRSNDFTDDKFSDLLNRGVVLHHGAKDDSLFKLAQKKLL